jgi:hypothetical protein
MVKYLWIVALLLLLSGCTGEPAVVCNTPYMINGQECCLDSDANAICDEDEGKAIPKSNETYRACPELDCSKCPAQVIEKEKVEYVTKYICEKDMKEVDDVEECEGGMKANPFEDYTLNTYNEEDSAIELFTTRPACTASRNSVEIHFELGSSAESITIQTKESPTAPWVDIYTSPEREYRGYLYGVFCFTACEANADFFIDPEKVYVLRAKIDYQELFGEYQFSNEHLIDAREEGSYLTKMC